MALGNCEALLASVVEDILAKEIYQMLQIIASYCSYIYQWPYIGWRM